MREKVKGARDEAKIRVNYERARVSTKTNAKTEALDIAKARAETKTKVNNTDGQRFNQIQDQCGGQWYRDNESCTRSKGNVKAEVKRNGKGYRKGKGLIQIRGKGQR